MSMLGTSRSTSGRLRAPEASMSSRVMTLMAEGLSASGWTCRLALSTVSAGAKNISSSSSSNSPRAYWAPAGAVARKAPRSPKPANRLRTRMAFLYTTYR
jgi:hypothetical protein